MRWQVEVAVRPELNDPHGEAVVADIRDLGIEGVETVRTASVYVLEGDLSPRQARQIAAELLADPVADVYSMDGSALRDYPDATIVQVVRKPGVMDPVAHSTERGISDMGLAVESIRTAKKYALMGPAAASVAETVSSKILANGIIEDVIIGPGPIPEVHLDTTYQFKRIEVPLLDASDAELERISRDGELSLNLAEMQTVRDYYAKIGRNPTDVELECIAQTWSEHCVHKTLKGIIDFNGETIDNLLKSTIARATHELNKPWCVSVFVDNAGVIEFDDDFDVCFKVETHNHPSALDPYGGAGTGIGGVIRDPMGTCMGAKPVFNTDVFCFGPPDIPHEELPTGVLHPKRIFKGVVAGVRDYGNRMGIPTGNGAILFDKRYIGNPLVYCGNVGLIPTSKRLKAARTGDLVVVVGGRTGRDGIHGATFSSLELHEESETTSSGAVQIGDPITEKKMLDVLLKARDAGLYSCITDCGAGGLSSAVGEMGEELGAEVDLDKVPLKYHGLSYTEIWISEAQERMVIAVPPEHETKIHKLFASEDVESTTIGRFTDTRRLVLRYEGNEVCDLEMEFLHDGVPRITRQAVWELPQHDEPDLSGVTDLGGELKKILAAWNVCSKEHVIRQYDHEVQGASVLKPLVGVAHDGPGDAAVIAPVLGSKRGVIISNGVNPCYGDIDPYHMTASAIDEALRQIIAVGGNIRQCGILDNFSWGNTNKPDRLGGLVRAAQACYDVAKAYGTPFISGKDSLNNEYQTEAGTIAIPPTMLISAIAVTDDITKTISMDAKQAGNLIFIVGLTKPELGGSHYYRVNGAIGNSVPQVDVKLGVAIFDAMSSATAAGLVRSCHDCSEGGLAVAAAEMAFAGGLGMEIALAGVPGSDAISRDDEVLFSESNSRFIVEVEPGKAKMFADMLRDVPHAEIGSVTDRPSFVVRGKDGSEIINERIAGLKESWQAPLRW